MKDINKALLKIKWIDAENSKKFSKILKDAFYVRKEVFIKEQKVSETEEYDNIDLTAYHVIVYTEKMPIATGRIFKDQETWFIGRISVLKACRKNQIGKLILEKLLERAVILGAQELHIHAQTQAVDFYKKFGFEIYGNTFLEANIEHISMVKKL